MLILEIGHGTSGVHGKNLMAKQYFPQGLNFALGGSGVFPSWKNDSLTVQIDQFEQLLKENVYSRQCDLEYSSSVALVSSGPNDYTFYSVAKKGSKDGLPAFTKGLVKQLAADLQRINRLGVKKVVVATLPVIGCLPLHTIPPNSYQNCDEESNKNARIHNKLLLKAVKKLNTDDGKKSTFVVLDLYNAMVSAIDQFRKRAANTEYKNPLQPCCSKIVDFKCLAEGVCPNPKSSFFFDLAHPSDNGWNAIFFISAMFSQQRSKSLRMLPSIFSIFRSTKSQTLYIVHLRVSSHDDCIQF
ncbi:hypothetical protein OIU77_013191 [Salix suchowensis]|uniref:GDSL esterase/lipase n=1 Tax=Salix suchowensis TaxID=1278906 RepID=A0ABQ8ZTN1_9ROSI|nr:hypothetical protein OIU77_013191 [Salix suchowensis]